MFEITVSTEFEDWYQSLDSASAEQVAAELNVLERLGPGLDSLRASRLLLWFDGMTSPQPELREQAAQLGQLMRRRSEALRCLETPSFQARFLKLEPRRAQQCQELIERLHARMRAARLQLLLERGQGERPDVGRIWLSDAVQAAVHEVLAFVGLRPEDVDDTSSGLRELTLSELTPAHRMIYAIDTPRRRILAILAEPLERAYYGDAVRFAERYWRDYCRDLPLSEHP
ncbi:MAG: hypothetical protein RL033_7051 [Pseudomonadota bacterium]